MSMALSAVSNAVTSTTDSSGGDVTIKVGTQTIGGWMSVAINRSAEGFPNHFMLTMTEIYVTEPTQILVQPGFPCQVFIGGDIVINGYVDRYASRIAPNAHQVEIVGRGICQDLVDCSAPLLDPNSPVQGGSISASSVVDLATKLAKPFGVNVVCKVDDQGPAIPTFQVGLGETPYELIERVARYAGFLIYEDEQGNLVLDRVGTQQMASGFQQGTNIEDAAVSFSADQRFSDITVVYSTIDQVSEGADANVWNRRASLGDSGMQSLKRADGMTRIRPRIVASTLTDYMPDFALRMVTWEVNRRFGRSQAVSLTCDSWRDSNGRLWQPNWLAMVDIPACKLVKRQWLIASVTFRKDDSGTHADLVLMPPAAFSVQPTPLTVNETELYYSVPASNPAPPTTGGGGP